MLSHSLSLYLSLSLSLYLSLSLPYSYSAPKSKGVDLPDITRILKLKDGVAENRHESMVARNAAGTTPFVELSDGSFLSESVAIVRYADATLPVGPNFSGCCDDPLAAARISMWQNRVELNITAPFQRQFQFGEGLPYFKDHVPFAEASVPSVPGLRKMVLDNLRWLDGALGGEGEGGGGGRDAGGEGKGRRAFVAGDEVSVGDLQLYTTLEFMSNPKVNAARLTPSFNPKGELLFPGGDGAGGGSGGGGGDSSGGSEVPWLRDWFLRMAAWEGDVGTQWRVPAKPAEPAGST